MTLAEQHTAALEMSWARQNGDVEKYNAALQRFSELEAGQTFEYFYREHLTKSKGWNSTH